MVHTGLNTALGVGDYVRKVRGARFEGLVTNVFVTTAGETRLVVEARHPRFAGTSHILSPDQVARTPCPKWLVTGADTKDCG